MSNVITVFAPGYSRHSGRGSRRHKKDAGALGSRSNEKKVPFGLAVLPRAESPLAGGL